MNILKAVPNSMLWFLHLPDAAEKNLKREAAKRFVYQ
jgi:predicted O-linked N-acetylglucosamine transferase (SPINDLY family)